MKRCSECNTEMIEDCFLEGQHPFEIGVDGRTDISLNIPLKEEITVLGMKKNKVKAITPKARICPTCGKIEFYVDWNNVR